jgi:hypothetical protein
MMDRGDAIAKKVVPLINKDIKTHVNYLRPSTQDDMFFIPDSQVEKTKEKGEELLWQGKNTTKVGRTWRQVLKDNNITFSDSQIETFVNNYKNAYKKLILKEQTDSFNIISGEDIRYWYYEGNYANGGGTLNNSCMRYKSCQKYLDIYVENPEVCQLLVLVEDELLLGRALIWKLKSGEYYLDRIYTKNDSDEDRFLDYFKEHFNSTNTYNGGFEDIDLLVVKIKKLEYNFYPYMDTFKYLDPMIWELSTFNDEEHVFFELTSTGGDYDSTGIWSDYEGIWIPNNRAVSISNYGWVHEDSTTESGYDNELFLSKDAVNSVYGYINKAESTQVGEDNWIPNRDLYYIFDESKNDWIPIPLKNYFNSELFEKLPKNWTKSKLSDGRKIIVSKEDIVMGIGADDPDLYIDDFNNSEENFVKFYQVENIPDSVEFRTTEYRRLSGVGFVDGIPVLSKKGIYYMIDQYMDSIYKLSNKKIVGYTNDITEYVRDVYSNFDFMKDKVDFSMYNFLESDIKYICRDNPMLGLYITNDKDIVGLFTKVVDASFNKLNSREFNFKDFESKNLSFFANRREEGFTNRDCMLSIIIHNIFDGIYQNSYINNFLRSYGLPKISYFSIIPTFYTQIGYNGSANMISVLSKRSYDVDRDDEFLDSILKYTLDKAKIFCSSNNL